MRIFNIHSSVIRKIVSWPITDDDDDNDTAGQQRTTEYSHTGHCTLTAESKKGKLFPLQARCGPEGG